MRFADSRSLYLTNKPASTAKRQHSSSKRTKFRALAFETLECREVLSGFDFQDFSSSGDLSLLGAAAITADDRLRLTPAVGGMNGAAWYTAEKQYVGVSFETTFQFQMSDNVGDIGGSDGFVFLIQNYAPTYLSGGGGTLGYYNLPNSLAVEFDTYQNNEVNDPSPSHISIHTNGTGPNSWDESLSLGAYNTPGLLDDGAIHTAKISYTPGSLSVYLDDLAAPVLIVSVDLSETLDLDASRAWVGFTATTGGGYQNHDILNWSYNVLVDTSSTIAVQDASVIEGNSGTTELMFTVNRSGDTLTAATVDWATEDRTALAGSDYLAASGQATFAPGSSQTTIAVTVVGDTASETNETMAVRLSNASAGIITDAIGIGTILNDDVTITISDASATEGSDSLKLIDRFISDGSGGLIRPRGMTFGPDGNGDGEADLYVASADTNEILRYDGRSGGFLDAFVTAGSGGLDSPADLKFGPDGDLYVTSLNNGRVLRYSGQTGAFVEEIADGLTFPVGLTFAADGRLFIADQRSNQVFLYNSSGLSVFVSAGSGGLDSPRNAVFGPDGDLYVASQGTGQVLRYDGSNGAFLGVFASTSFGDFGQGPRWIEFGADGHLYVTVQGATSPNDTYLLRFDQNSGAFVDSFELQNGWSFIVGPDNMIYNSGNAAGNVVDRIGPSSLATFTMTLSGPSALPVSVNYATASGTALAWSDFTPVAGTLTIPAGDTSKAIIVNTIDDSIAEANETFQVNLKGAIGGTITDGQGVATIADDDTKFYVVDDASANRTFEYGVDGSAGESYPLSSGNAAPRGAASTAAGDKVWVVDSNQTVYVYGNGGALLGSWTAGTMNASAKPEGIATDGTDIWIVDAKGDKVYRYAGAASRLSGTQNATSSFALNSGNKDATDIVTDGASLWVTNDSTANKVFKYTLSGALLGSWTIDPANSTPTGITLDPSNPSNLWIVDAGTDRVYQYNAAVGRTSGSQNASLSFALAAGNTNPQGIADPPVAAAADVGAVFADGGKTDPHLFESNLAPQSRADAHDEALTALTSDLEFGSAGVGMATGKTPATDAGPAASSWFADSTSWNLSSSFTLDKQGKPHALVNDQWDDILTTAPTSAAAHDAALLALIDRGGLEVVPSQNRSK